ncbi:MAG: ABC transporter ATP-binding protein [Ignavibacteria bacterium]|nr:ABC transporter ATP-binding protein [Ignavibacteria bacterium]
MRIEAEGLTKTFNRRVIFRDVSFALGIHQVLRVVGRNGSGKSTLVKIVAHTLSPTRGSVAFRTESSGAAGESPQRLIGLVSPYLQMYDEFSAYENLELGSRIRGLRPVNERMETLLSMVGLFARRHDAVRTYSSGMKQRLKYAFALVHTPPVLILDEPMANLDAEGMDIVRRIMEEQRREGILIVATNDLNDLDSFDFQIDLNATH